MLMILCPLDAMVRKERAIKRIVYSIKLRSIVRIKPHEIRKKPPPGIAQLGGNC
jgi:hypothetical protein